jgi:hypothetical protein
LERLENRLEAAPPELISSNWDFRNRCMVSLIQYIL